jgi:hypothetical protein
MSKHENNRVLNRIGARELTAPEAEFVYGAAAFNTLVCTLPVFNVRTQTHTGGDGDGCSDTDSDNS